MARDAESHAADDRKRKDQIEARNKADAMVYKVEKTLKEHRDKIGEADAKNIEAAIEDVKKAINENDADKLNAATDKLTQASHKLAEAMYKASRSGSPAAGRWPQGAPPPPPTTSRRKTWSTPNSWMSTIRSKTCKRLTI